MTEAFSHTGIRRERASSSRWDHLQLSKLLRDLQTGFACGERDPDGVIQLRMNNVDTRGNFVWNEFIRVPATAEAIEEYRLLPGDVLFNNTNSTELVGKSALFEHHDEPVVFSNHFTRLRTHADRLLPAFLAGWLNYQWHEGLFARICDRWIGQSAISSGKLRKLMCPLPPLEEQQPIVATLLAHLAAAGRAQATATVRLQAAEAVPAAYLREVLGSTSWQVRPLGDGLTAIEAGTSIRSDERPASDGEWGVLKVSAVSWGRFRPDENKTVPSNYRPKPGEEVRRGDLLISRCNTVELVGAVVLVRETRPYLMLSDKTLRLVPRNDAYKREFLELALRSPIARQFIEARATGTSYSMRNISQETIRGIPIPTPPPDEQARIVGGLSPRLDAADRLITESREELAAIERLPAVLLRNAFQFLTS